MEETLPRDISTPAPVASASAAPPTGSIAAVQKEVRLPPFWTKNPRVGFLQVEALFELRRITSPASQYLNVASSLLAEVADSVVDILSTPPATKQYQKLNTAILSRRSPSEHSRLKQLVTAEESVDRRPTEMLRQMRKLLGDQGPESDNPLLREIFL